MNVDHFRLPELPRRTGCPDHPDEAVTGVCASCLRERLAIFDPETRRMKSSASSATAGLKTGIRTAVSGIAPELRRTRSFSTRGRSECSTSGQFEPQRKSCDVRVRNTLRSLFHDDDEKAIAGRETWGEIELGRSSATTASGAGLVRTVFESREEEELEEEDEKNGKEEASVQEKEIRAEEEEIGLSMERDCVDECSEERTMKAHMDLDSRVSSAAKKQTLETGKDSAGGFWLASVFTKRIQKWRRNQRSKKAAATTQVPSEITETARRSCDTEPRFSIDAGRNSWDLPRFSLDEPRASWDGYLIGKAFSRPSLSGVDGTVGRDDNLIPVQEDAVILVGSTQTRDYYSDSSSSPSRRKSLSNSHKLAGEEMPTLNCNEPSKVSVSISDDFQGSASFCDYSLRDDFSGSLGEIAGGSKRLRKSRRWSSIWGFIHRRAKEEDRDYRNSGINRSFSQSWQELHRETNGGHMGGLGRRDFRCNSSMSSRSSRSRSLLGDHLSNGMEMNGSFAFLKSSAHKKKKKKKRDESVLDRNRSARYSPSHFDNGLLRFYLTPLRSSRKNGSMGNGKVKNAHSFARSVLRLY